MWTYFVQCVKSTGFVFWSITCFIIFNTANFIDISFYFAMGHKIIIYFFVYNKARQKGATWFLMGAIWFFPTGCPMGNMIFLGVVKAWIYFRVFSIVLSLPVVGKCTEALSRAKPGTIFLHIQYHVLCIHGIDLVIPATEQLMPVASGKVPITCL